jgi:pimeloyl-ACP methyl ester carboxylesterase
VTAEKELVASSESAAVEAFAENIARHIVIPKAGHFVAEEQPEALLEELKSFLDN